MENDRALELSALIFAAYPAVFISNATAATYARFLSELDNPARAAEAVDVAIRTCKRMPTIADVREAYRGLAAKYAPKAIEESTGDGPLTPEERERNLGRLREMISRLSPASGRTPTNEGATE